MGLRRTSIAKVLAAGQGFSLLEVLLVMSLLGIVAGTGLFMSMESLRGYAFRNEREMIVSVLQKARSQALSNLCLGACPLEAGRPHGVYFGAAGEYIIFQGDDYNSRDQSADEIIAANSALSYDAASARQVTFAQLSGSVVSPGAVKISDSAGRSASIAINGAGQIDW